MTDVFTALADVLEPFLRTVQDRQTLLNRAFGSADFLNRVFWEADSVQTFVTNTVILLAREQFGERSALWRLMEVAQEHLETLDPEQRQEIADLETQLDAFVANVRAGGTRIFLSYARADDEPFVKRLHHDLTQCGFTVWWDRVAMPNRGLTFLQEIRDALDISDRLVLVAGKAAVTSDAVRVEWEYALSQCKPVNIALRACDYSDLPGPLAHYDAPDFRDDMHYEERLGTLVRQLNDAPSPRGPLIGVPELPPHFLPRALDMLQLQDLVIGDVQAPVVVSAARQTNVLTGMGGIGKSALAAAFAVDCVVRRAFPDGIIWLTVGQKPSLRVLYQELGVALGDSVINYPLEEPTCHKRAHHALNGKRCLIILDDVWDLAIGRAFQDLIVGMPARLLITTRHLHLNDQLGAKEHCVRLLTEKQAVTLLTGWIGHEDPFLPTVAQQLGYLPLALRLAGARMVKDGLTAAEYAMNFDRVSRMKTDRKAIGRDDNLDASITLSVEAVFSDHTEDALLYYTFGAFPEDTRVPQATVLHFWRYLRPNVDVFDLEETLNELVDLALVERHADKSITLHDVLHGFTKEHLGDHYGEIQQQFLASYQVQPIQSWTDLPATEPYLWDTLIYHLIQAGRADEAYVLLTDSPAWMERKYAVQASFSSLVRDLEQVRARFKQPLHTGAIIQLTALWAARCSVEEHTTRVADLDLQTLVWLDRDQQALAFARLRETKKQLAESLLALYLAQAARGAANQALLQDIHTLHVLSESDIDAATQDLNRRLLIPGAEPQPAEDTRIQLSPPVDEVDEDELRRLLDSEIDLRDDDWHDGEHFVVLSMCRALVQAGRVDEALHLARNIVGNEKYAGDALCYSAAGSIIMNRPESVSLFEEAANLWRYYGTYVKGDTAFSEKEALEFLVDTLIEHWAFAGVVDIARLWDGAFRIHNTWEEQGHYTADHDLYRLLGVLLQHQAFDASLDLVHKAFSSRIVEDGLRLVAWYMAFYQHPQASDIFAQVETLAAQNEENPDENASYNRDLAMNALALALTNIGHVQMGLDLAHTIRHATLKSAALASLALVLAGSGDPRMSDVLQDTLSAVQQIVTVYYMVDSSPNRALSALAIVFAAFGLNDTALRIAENIKYIPTTARYIPNYRYGTLLALSRSFIASYLNLANTARASEATGDEMDLDDIAAVREALVVLDRLEQGQWEAARSDFDALDTALQRSRDAAVHAIAQAIRALLKITESATAPVTPTDGYDARFLAAHRHQLAGDFEAAYVAASDVRPDSFRFLLLQRILRQAANNDVRRVYGILSNELATTNELDSDYAHLLNTTSLLAFVGDITRAFEVLGPREMDAFLGFLFMWCQNLELRQQGLTLPLIRSAVRVAAWRSPFWRRMYDRIAEISAGS